MGIYLNPGNMHFQKALNSEIYIDKTMLIDFTNRCLNTEQGYICVSRPRRFGKSMAANMLTAYYSYSYYHANSTQYFKEYGSKSAEPGGRPDRRTGIGIS